MKKILWIILSFNFLEGKLSIFIMNLGFPIWIHDMLVYGLFRVTGWVISVMKK